MGLKQANHPGLRAAFAGLRKEYTEQPPAKLEALLLAQMRTRRRVRQARIWSAMGAVAALIVLALLCASRYRGFLPTSAPPVAAIQRELPVPDLTVTSPSIAVEPAAVPARRMHSRRTQPPRANWTDTDGFVAVPYAEPLAPSEQIDVYRVELPRAALTHYGLPVRSASIDSPVTADVAVASDGVVRAIRLVH